MVLGWSGRRKIGSLAHGMFSTALVRVDRLWRGRDLQYKDFFSFLFVFLSLRYGHTSVTLAGVLTHMCGYSGLWLWLGKRQKQKSYVINAVWSGMPWRSPAVHLAPSGNALSELLQGCPS